MLTFPVNKTNKRKFKSSIIKNTYLKFACTTIFLSTTLISCHSDDDATTRNNAPNPFNLIEVTNGAVDVDLTPIFSWQAATDTDEDAIVYDLYLGTEENPTTIYAENLSANNLHLTNRLNTFETYYWKVIVKDEEGATTSIAINQFTVRDLNLYAAAITPNASFSARAYHTTTAFNDKLWVIGGDDGSFKNDVWAFD